MPYYFKFLMARNRARLRRADEALPLVASEYRLRTAADVEQLRRHAFRVRRPLILKPLFTIDDDLASLERAANRHRADCGCGIGAGFLITALVSYATLAVFHLPTTVPGIFAAMLGLVGSALSAAFIGKGLGILRARRQYYRCLDLMLISFHQREESQLVRSPQEEKPCLVDG
jgi:hypothetical protein